MLPVNDAGDEIEPEPWHDLYFRAWDAIRYDRSYGAFGGESPLSYMVISQYARDNGITGDDMGLFLTFMTMLDGEHLAIVAEREKQRHNQR